MPSDISPAAATDRPAALARLGLPADTPAGHLLVARRGGRVVGAAFAEVAGGGLAEVLPPAADDPATAVALAVALVERLRVAGVVVAQCLTDTPGPADPLVQAGFRRVTRLVTLGRPAGPAHTGHSPLTVEPADGPELLAAFTASLVGSLDLPELSGVRLPAAELAAYPAAGRFLARHGGDAVGVLLLAPTEVLYLGLVPAARGRGLGRHLLRFALAESSVPLVTVSADGRNSPALRLYVSHGFRPCRSQEVLLWTATG